MGRISNYESAIYKQFEELNKKLDSLLKENKEMKVMLFIKLIETKDINQ
ncbi:MAG: hypothetical protein IJR82_01290 [Bacilli bacterium]|nr:hypothetical protein [Bacilli bacterium]